MAAEMNEDRRSMDDLEEGECSDSDDEAIISDKIPPIYSMGRLGNGTDAYARTRIPQIVIHSDESGEEDSDSDDDDDDDHCPSAGKKRRGNLNSQTSMFTAGSNADQAPFVNPLLSSSHQSVVMSAESLSGKKKRNNVWGSVLTEQILSHDIKQFGVKKTNLSDGYRGVESYDFSAAQEDDRPDMNEEDIEQDDRGEIFDEVVDLEKEVKKHENRKRKRNVKERLGRRTYDKNKPRNLGVDENSDVPDVVHAITGALGEPNITLFTRIVEAIGRSKAIRLYCMTEDVERAGGMMINNGCRRRTAGGVYIQLMKTETGISEDIIKSVFGEDEERWRTMRKEERREKRSARRRYLKTQAATSKPDMELDRPQTPTPTEELEALDTLENSQDNDGEIVDFPERPATPEPKDDSSDGDEAEDDDDEDISVIIAKAKAAILRKQQQQEDVSSSDQKPGESLDTDSQNVDMHSVTDVSQSHLTNVMTFSEDIDLNDICDD